MSNTPARAQIGWPAFMNHAAHATAEVNNERVMNC